MADSSVHDLTVAEIVALTARYQADRAQLRGHAWYASPRPLQSRQALQAAQKDRMTDAAYLDWQCEIAAEIAWPSKPAGHLFLSVGWSSVRPAGYGVRRRRGQ